jgi:hypothetical protein
MSGGDEPRSVCGHLGLGEPIVKPTVYIRSVLFGFIKGVLHDAQGYLR